MICLAIKWLCILTIFVLLSSCTVYTEKRSESLSQAVFASSDSIANARFDLAAEYSKQAERLAYPPKQRIEISPIYTTAARPTASTSNGRIFVHVKDELKKSDDTLVTSELDENNEIPTLRLVIPENLKHTKLLVENSVEWADLVKTKNFSNQLQEDHKNLQILTNNINEELQKQTKMNSQMIMDLNTMKKKLVEKDLAILQRNIIIASLLVTIGGGIYLRIKGIL